MIHLQNVHSEPDWNSAAKLLHRVVIHLNSIGQSLWSFDQISVEGLVRSYKNNELYFLVDDDSDHIGVVFLQETDPLFWPELQENNSLFVHKLAIEPAQFGRDYGARALELIAQEARLRKLNWLRLDCDDREPLHKFYQTTGFGLVDFKQVQGFKVARYQRALNN